MSQFLLGAAAAQFPPGVKVKGMFMDGVAASPPPASTWTQIWLADAHVEQFIQQADLLKSAGCNTVGTTLPFTGFNTGGSDRATCIANVQSVMQHCQDAGLWFYPRLGDPAEITGTAAQQAAVFADIAAAIDPYECLLAIDVWTEININHTVGQVTALTSVIQPQVRAVTRRALTYSLSVTGSSGWNSAYVTALAPYVDFQDFHPYYGGAYTPTGGGHIPVTDVNAYRALPSYRPWFIGESGAPLQAGTGVQTTRWTDLGTLASQSDCYGCVGFLGVTYDNTPANDFGAYANDFVTPRTQITVPFAAWPSTF